MKGLADLVKTTLVGGLLVLLPLLLSYMLLREALGLITALATPIADLLFPPETFQDVDFPEFVAIVLLVGVSFVVGLVVRSAIGRRLGSGIESATVGRLPLYGVLKSFTQTLMGSDRAEAFRPAILAGADGSIELAYLIEDHGNGRATILLPWSPTAMAGSLRVVSREQVRLLNTDLGEFTRVLGQWGVGTKEMLGKGEL